MSNPVIEETLRSFVDNPLVPFLWAGIVIMAMLGVSNRLRMFSEASKTTEKKGTRQKPE
jgi:hypothetical protein